MEGNTAGDVCSSGVNNSSQISLMLRIGKKNLTTLVLAQTGFITMKKILDRDHRENVERYTSSCSKTCFRNRLPNSRHESRKWLSCFFYNKKYKKQSSLLTEECLKSLQRLIDVSGCFERVREL